MPKKNQFLLTGDIGGTKSTLAIYHPKDGLRHPLAQAIFPERELFAVN